MRSHFETGPVDDFPLWGFFDNQKEMVVTRGRSSEEAWLYAGKSFWRGGTIKIASSLPIHAAKQYSLNHRSGWLKRMPVWIKLHLSAAQILKS